GGGGGRVAVTFTSNLFIGTMTAYGGSGTNRGGAGTVYLKTNNAFNGQVLISKGGQIGTNTPIFSSSTTDLVISSNGVGVATSAASLANLTVASNGVLIVSNAV